MTKRKLCWQTVSARKIAAVLKEFRDRNEHRFPTPNRLDSIRFACSEVGEVMSDFLSINGDFSRNNDKERDMIGELGDVLFMLITASTQGELEYGIEWADTFTKFGSHPKIIPTVDDLVILTGEALAEEHKPTFPYSFPCQVAIYSTISMINTAGECPIEVVRDRLTAIEERLDREGS